MQGRERLQALQARLGAARAAADRGDRETALAEVDAALALDPEFLAAHALRDRLVADAAAAAAAAPPADPAAAPAPAAASAPPPSSGVSTDGYARFQERTKRRRLDKRIDAARVAIDRGRLKDAAAALDEVIELDPALPELVALTEQFDTLRRAATASRGPWLAAAAVFAGTVFGASWLQDSSSLISRPVLTAGILAPVAVPSVAVSTDVTAIGTTGTRDAVDASAPGAGASPAWNDSPTVSAPVVPARVSAAEVTEMPLPPAAPIALQDPPVDESALVHKTLQRYRLAYQDLDAQSAQAVWPAVNTTALARAFDGLESQTLTFDACDVRVSGEAATATCQGSARYVPKIGSRELRVEPRVWSFTLHKSGGDWKIDSARVER